MLGVMFREQSAPTEITPWAVARLEMEPSVVSRNEFDGTWPSVSFDDSHHAVTFCPARDGRTPTVMP